MFLALEGLQPGAEVWCGWNREQIRMHKEWIEEHRSYRSALARFNAALAE